MRVPPEPQLDVGGAKFFLNAVGWNKRPPGGALAEFRLRMSEPGAQSGPQPVGADERDAVFVGGGRAAPAGDAEPVGVLDEILDLGAETASPSGARASLPPLAVLTASASGTETAARSRSPRPSAIRMRVALGES